MVDEKAEEMADSFERTVRSQGIDPQQYYQLAGSNRAEIKERVREDAADTVKKELVLEAVAAAENIEVDEHEAMHQIEHLAENTDRSPEEIAETMRRNGTLALLEEEISRAQALDLLVENAVPVPMPEEETEEDAGVGAEGTAESTAESTAEGGEEVPGTEEAVPEAGEARVEASVQAGEGAAGTENNEREE